MSTVHIVIVNYRTADMVLDCLASLAPMAAERRGLRVTVVDNASPDDSAQRLRTGIDGEGYGAWCDLLVSDGNLGFAGGNNAAIRRVLGSAEPASYIWLLNPDTVVRPGALDRMVQALDVHAGAGIVGSALEDDRGRVLSGARRRPSALSELNGAARLGLLSRLLAGYVVSQPMRDQAHRCDWVSGASMMVRREVFQRIGLLDEGYFLYYEELDFCERARVAGWEVWHEPAARIVHLEGASTGINEQRRRRPGYWYASRRRFFLKRYGRVGLIVADACWAAGRFSLVLRRLLRLGGSFDGDPIAYSRDLLIGDLRALLGRVRVQSIRSTRGRATASSASPEHQHLCEGES